MASDTIANPVELPKIANNLDFIPLGSDGSSAFQGSHVSVWHNGLVVIVREYSPTDVLGEAAVFTFFAYRWNGASWDNLDFPTEIGYFAPLIDPDTGRPVPGAREPFLYEKFMRLVSDGTTMWLAACIDETQKDAPAGPGAGEGVWWRNMTTYVWAFDDSSGWSQILISRGACRHNSDDIANGHGWYDHQLGTHEGAGYAWLVQNEAGIQGLDWHEATPIGGGGIFPFIYQWHAYPFIDVLVTGSRLTPTGSDEGAGLPELEDPQWYIDQVAERDLVHPWILDGPPADPAPAFTGSAIGMKWARIFAVVTDAGFPLVITNVYSGHPDAHQLLDYAVAVIDGTEVLQAPLSAANLATGEQLQATNDVMAQGSERTVYEAWVRNGTVYLNTPWDITEALNGDSPGLDADLFYPEEVDETPGVFTADDRNRVRLFTIPADASSGFATLKDQGGEDISLAKNPLKVFGPQDWGVIVSHFGAISAGGNVWLLVHASDRHGDGLIFAFHLNPCPVAPPEHGRYVWDWATDNDGDLVNIAPFDSEGGFFFVGADWFNGPTSSLFSTVYSAAEQRIYVVAWAISDDGNTYLRAWYFQLCLGCDKCIQGMHVWQVL